MPTPARSLPMCTSMTAMCKPHLTATICMMNSSISPLLWLCTRPFMTIMEAFVLQSTAKTRTLSSGDTATSCWASWLPRFRPTVSTSSSVTTKAAAWWTPCSWSPSAKKAPAPKPIRCFWQTLQSIFHYTFTTFLQNIISIKSVGDNFSLKCLPPSFGIICIWYNRYRFPR